MDQVARERAFLRWAGATYAAASVLTAFAALARGGDGVLRRVALTLLAPLGLVLGGRALGRAAVLLRGDRGQRLEAAVRRDLARLGRAYCVTTSRCPGDDRETQVAIGPNGVFVVLASEDGRRTGRAGSRFLPLPRPRWRDLVEDCRIEALRVEERLRRALGDRPPVHPLVCLRRALVSVGRQVRSVRIVTLSQLTEAIAGTSATAPLTDAQIRAALAALENAARVVPLRPDTRPPRAPVVSLARQRRLAARRPSARVQRH